MSICFCIILWNSISLNIDEVLCAAHMENLRLTLSMMNLHASSFSVFNVRRDVSTVAESRTRPNWKRKVTSPPSIFPDEPFFPLKNFSLLASEGSLGISNTKTESGSWCLFSLGPPSPTWLSGSIRDIKRRFSPIDFFSSQLVRNKKSNPLK